MTDTGREGNKKVDEPEDMLEITERIRSLPRIKPGRAFRTKMAVYCYMPSFACRLIERREAAAIEQSGSALEAERRPTRAVKPARIATAVALVLLIAFGVFGALTLAARHSQPGNPLYSVKRFRENLELAFTWNQAKKAQKNLALAQTRLSELDYLITKKQLDPASLTTVAGDYTAKRVAVENILRRDGAMPDAQSVASQLRVVDTTAENIEKRLATAGANAALSPASGAQVTVRDARGRPTLDAGKSSVRTKSDANGQVSVSSDIDGGEGARNLEAFIELDGRSEVLPVYPAAFETTRGTLTATVSPRISAIEMGRPQLFTLTLTTSDGASLGGKEVRVVDKTATSSINGVGGEVALTTAYDGSCTFTLIKNSLDYVSRITATIINGAVYDLGEVLAVGGLRTVAGNGSPSGVSVRNIGPPAGPQNIELDNGLIRVTAGGGRRGYIIDGITGVAEPGKAGPLYDPLAIDNSGNEADNTEVSGPRLAFANAGAAGYVVDLEAPNGLRKSYQVVLAKGKPYVTVGCRIESDPEKGPAVSNQESYIEVSRLEIGQGSELNVSDKKVPPNTSDNPLELIFQVGRPYAVVESGGCRSIMTFPINSETYPNGWSLGRSYIAPTVRPLFAGSQSGANFTFILGTGDSKVIDSVKTQSLRGIDGSTESEAGRAAADNADGFAVEPNPSINALRNDEQTLVLSIYKRYERVLGK